MTNRDFRLSLYFAVEIDPDFSTLTAWMLSRADEVSEVHATFTLCVELSRASVHVIQVCGPTDHGARIPWVCWVTFLEN
jgi:hypothetical protein